MAAAAPSALINVKGVYGSKSFEYGLVKLTPSRCSPSNNAWKKKAKLYGHMSCKQQVRASAEYYGGSKRGNVTGDFVAGLLLGGAIFGTLGYVFAPQISRSLLSFDRSTFTLEELEDWWLRRKLPKSLIDDKDLMITRKSLNDKIDELNAAIDEVAGQLKSGQVPKSERAPSQKDSAPPDVTNAAHC